MSRATRIARISADWIAPLVVLGVGTIIFRTTSLDLDAAGAFYDHGWHRANAQPWSALYHYGVVPAWVVSVGSLLLLAASRWKASLAAHRRVFAYLALVMIVGPGLIVNTTFKEHWGRPRPVDLPQFGGSYAFLQVWDKGDPDRGQSFPSGHASTGFYFFALYFALRDRSRGARQARQARFWLAFALAYGSLMGLARMIQGKHFASDVLWSAGFVWLASVSLYYAMALGRRRPAA